MVGVATGSLAILAEAAHSALDLLAAGITLLVVQIADLPPDDNHPTAAPAPSTWARWPRRCCWW